MAVHLENLKPWKPGTSGNPGGRPRKKPITELYEQLLNEPATLEALRKAILRTIKSRKTAVVPLLREIADRVEGKVTQPIDAKVNWAEHLTDEELQNEIQRLKEELRAAEHAGPEN